MKLVAFEVSSNLFRTTPLKTLVLERCLIEPKILAIVLSLPKALTHLSLRESRSFAFFLDQSFRAFIEALSKQKESLEFLQHTCPEYGVAQGDSIAAYTAESPSAAGLSDFLQLKTVELDHRSILVKLMSYKEYAPPRLQKYCLTKVSRSQWRTNEVAAQLSTVVRAVKFRELEVHLGSESCSLKNRHIRLTRGDLLAALLSVARLMKQHNITTSLVAWKHDPNIIEPFLYGESTPSCRQIFDSERYWAEENKYAKLVGAGQTLGIGLKGEDKERTKELKEEGADGTVRAAQVATGWRAVFF